MPHWNIKKKNPPQLTIFLKGSKAWWICQKLLSYLNVAPHIILISQPIELPSIYGWSCNCKTQLFVITFRLLKKKQMTRFENIYLFAAFVCHIFNFWNVCTSLTRTIRMNFIVISIIICMCHQGEKKTKLPEQRIRWFFCSC